MSQSQQIKLETNGNNDHVFNKPYVYGTKSLAIKSRRCGECKGCTNEDCGQCVACLGKVLVT